METDYNKQATGFLEKTGTKLSVKYLRTGKYFPDDKEDRDIYSVTLDNGRIYTFEFGQSIHHSRYKIASRQFTRNEILLTKEGKVNRYDFSNKYFTLSPKEIASIQYPKEPTAYDILTCLTKYDPGTFENFCSDFGYDTDSKTAEKTYQAVVNEWLNIERLFSPDEILELAEIA